jgi:hypothetical protein
MVSPDAALVAVASEVVAGAWVDWEVAVESEVVVELLGVLVLLHAASARAATTIEAAAVAVRRVPCRAIAVPLSETV